MGILNLSVVEEAHKMKIFFFVLLVAGVWAEPEAEPKAEADPQYYGYALGHNLGYSGLTYGYPTYGYRSYASPGVYSGYGYHSIGKREAEAEPKAKADPYLYGYGGYGLGYSSLGYSGLTYGYPGYGYSSYAYPRVYSNYEYHSIGKREAEAEPEADPDAYGYNRLGYSRLGYGYSRLGYGLGGYRSYFGTTNLHDAHSETNQ